MIPVNTIRMLQFLAVWFLLTGCTPVPTEAQTVYVTKSGAKYHAEGCRYLSHSKIAITLAKAREQGYGPCSACSPGTNVIEEREEEASVEKDTTAKPLPLMREKPKPTQRSTEQPRSTQPSKSSQCAAFTKSGARCKRAAGANGKCWQHQ